MKKKVSSSNLALRFYKSDLWTRTDIEPYLIKGSLTDTSESHGYSEDLSYYILSAGSRLDMKKFYEEKISEVHRAFNDRPWETDLQFMEGKNW